MCVLILVFALLLIAPSALAGQGEPTDVGAFSWGHRIGMYVPNRILDVLDLVRLRVRLGPGTAFGARATEAADFFLGSYGTVYAGLPGPRGRRLPRLPVGLESRTGVEVGAADLSTGFGGGPDYGAGELGLGFQVFPVGLDVGVDPIEAADLGLGLFLLDLSGDDL